jgi:hypothetical protein
LRLPKSGRKLGVKGVMDLDVRIVMPQHRDAVGGAGGIQ